MKMLERHYDELAKQFDIAKVQAVDISNVAHWWYEENAQEAWDVVSDIPCGAVPFFSMWMEYSAIKRMNIGGSVVELDNDTRETDWGTYAGAWGPDRDIVTWVVFASIRKRLLKTDTVLVHLDSASGAIRGISHKRNQFDHVYEKSAENNPFFVPFLFATSLMHAKNVEMIDNPLTPAVAKRRQRDGKPAITFKVLDIRSMRRQAVNAKEGGDTSAKRAMHIVRGHFKDYRESGGLFGKHRGLYWWDMHVSGQDSDRKVIKDYRVDAPD